MTWIREIFQAENCSAKAFGVYMKATYAELQAPYKMIDSALESLRGLEV